MDTPAKGREGSGALQARRFVLHRGPRLTGDNASPSLSVLVCVFTYCNGLLFWMDVPGRSGAAQDRERSNGLHGGVRMPCLKTERGL